MKKLRKWFLVCMMLFITLTMATTALAAVRINKSKASITVGQKLQLKISGTAKKVKWSSSNKKVATVSSKGQVKAVGKGNCVITAKIGQKKYKCKLTVKKRNSSGNSNMISKDAAWRAIQRYVDSTYGLDSLKNRGGWICDDGKSGSNYKYTMRSYTGSYVYFYLNEVTGVILKAEKNPITNQIGSPSQVSNAYSFLP